MSADFEIDVLKFTENEISSSMLSITIIINELDVLWIIIVMVDVLCEVNPLDCNNPNVHLF